MPPLQPTRYFKARAVLWVGLGAFLLLVGGMARPLGGSHVDANDPVSFPTALPPVPEGMVRVAAIGDYGSGNQAEAAVAQLVHSWTPDLVITLGDNNYPDGEAETIDRNIGQFYHRYIAPYQGSYGPGAETNRFYPALGNHDWRSLSCQGNVCSGPYFDYFTLPGNERYYDFVHGPIHFFVLDSDPHEPDGRDAHSIQADWLREGLARSTTPWQIVYMHHTIYSSSLHGSEPTLQWPYGAWGADLVLTGHDHTYERIQVDGLTYIVNGLGGASIRGFGPPVPGSQMRFNDDYGALLIEATATWLDVRFITREGLLVDRWTQTRQCAPLGGTLPAPPCTSVWLPWIVRP